MIGRFWNLGPQFPSPLIGFNDTKSWMISNKMTILYQRMCNKHLRTEESKTVVHQFLSDQTRIKRLHRNTCFHWFANIVVRSVNFKSFTPYGIHPFLYSKIFIVFYAIVWNTLRHFYSKFLDVICTGKSIVKNEKYWKYWNEFWIHELPTIFILLYVSALYITFFNHDGNTRTMVKM